MGENAVLKMNDRDKWVSLQIGMNVYDSNPTRVGNARLGLRVERPGSICSGLG